MPQSLSDIFRGFGTLIYGEGAIGGVVAFETNDPDDFLDIFGSSSYFGFTGGYYASDSSWGLTPVIALHGGNWDALLAYTRRDGIDLDSAPLRQAKLVDHARPAQAA